MLLKNKQKICDSKRMIKFGDKNIKEGRFYKANFLG